MTVQPPLFLPGWDIEPCDTADPDTRARRPARTTAHPRRLRTGRGAGDVQPAPAHPNPDDLGRPAMTLPADAWHAVHRVLTRLRDALAALPGRAARRGRGDRP